MSDTTKGGAGHTPGPWKYGTGSENCSIVGGDTVIAHTIADGSIGAGEANAARIVACVNACEGISTEALTVGAIKTTLQQMGEACDTVAAERDALRAENARLREALEECVTETPGAACYNTGKKTRRLEAINETVRAALTGARP